MATIPIGLPAPQNAVSPLPRLAHAVAAGEGSLWVTNENSDTVTRIDPMTNRVQATIHVRSPSDVGVVTGAAWVAGDGTPATWIDPGTNKTLEIVLPSALAEGLAVAADEATGSAYVAGEGRGSCKVESSTQVAEIARSTEVDGPVSLGQEYYTSGAVVAGGSLWVTGGSSVYRIDRGHREDRRGDRGGGVPWPHGGGPVDGLHLGDDPVVRRRGGRGRPARSVPEPRRAPSAHRVLPGSHRHRRGIRLGHERPPGRGAADLAGDGAASGPPSTSPGRVRPCPCGPE